MDEENEYKSMSVMKEWIRGLLDTCQDEELLNLVWKLLARG